MKKMKNDNKGFTLVELIVVLVILAILAAILVPALLGYIDEAKQKQYVLNGKSAYTAAQAVMSELYAKDDAPSEIAVKTGNNAAQTIANGKVLSIADVPNCTGLQIGFVATGNDGTTGKEYDRPDYTVVYVKYTENGTSVYLIDGAWETLTTDPDTSSYTVYTVK